MSTPPPRKFQIHLSTAIVMMFVAGGLIWANTTKHWIPKSEKAWPYFANMRRGWPFPLQLEIGIAEAEWVFLWKGVIYNGVCAAAILLSVYFFCEWLIRHRAAQKKA